MTSGGRPSRNRRRRGRRGFRLREVAERMGAEIPTAPPQAGQVETKPTAAVAARSSRRPDVQLATIGRLDRETAAAHSEQNMHEAQERCYKRAEQPAIEIAMRISTLDHDTFVALRRQLMRQGYSLHRL